MASVFRFLSSSSLRYGSAALLGVVILGGGGAFTVLNSALAQTPAAVGAKSPAPSGTNQPITLRADVQEANSITGVITARGNVQINYPARQIQATSVQAQYYSREKRIVLQGNVYVLQNGNSLRGETVTYLIDEGRFVALPNDGKQVESIYLVQDNPSPEAVSPPGQPPFNPKPAFKTPISPP
jgi:lipopolysaccharide export system protein LptA